MGFFAGPEETERRARLKALEDKRVRFTEALLRQDFRPERMVMVSTDRGGFVGLCRDKGQICIVIAPDFGSADDFRLERYDAIAHRKEEFFEASEGLGGVLGMGKKGATGFKVILEGRDGDIEMPVIAHRNSALDCKLNKNPLLDPKRRRGDANVVWDMQPLEKRMLEKIEKAIDMILKG